MEIRCKSSKRFLANVEIEKYHEQLKRMGIDISTPLIMTFACPRCKLIEEYEVYPTFYKHIKSFSKELQKK